MRPRNTADRSPPPRAAKRRLSLAQIGGTRIRLSVRGEGPPLLLIMGLGGSIEMWDPLEEALNFRGIQTIAYDASGTGHSPARLLPKPMTGLARQAAQILDSLGHRRADVLGISFGGAVAQELALLDPSRVRRLVLTSTTCGVGGVPGNPLALSQLTSPLRYYSPTYLRLAADVLFGSGVGGGGSGDRGGGGSSGGAGGEMGEHRASIRRDSPPTLWGYLGQLAAAVGWTSLPRLHRIKCPTLVLAGASDLIVPPANSRILASYIPNARLEIVPEAGHLLLTDRPELCATTIAGFLGHPPGTA